MAPGIRTGDVVLSIPVDASTVKIGQVLLVKSPDHANQLRLHRLVGVNEAGELITKGDANPTNDSTPVARSVVRGVAFLRVPFVGLPGFWLREGNAVALATVAVGAVALLALTRIDRGITQRDGAGERSRSISSERGYDRGHRVTGVVAIVAAIVATGLAATMISPASHAAFSRSTSNPTETFDAASAFSCLSPTPAYSPFLYYGFGETSGTTAVDSGGSGHTGTLHGGATHVSGSCASGSGPALALDGSTGYISTPTQVSSPETFSLAMWFTTTTTTGGRLIGFGTAQTGTSSQFDRHVYMTDSGHLMFGVYSGGIYTVTSPLPYNDGVWHHVVATLSSTGLHLAVDGVQVAANTSVAVGETDTGYWRIGYDNLSGWPDAPTSDYFKGTIDDAAVYTSALTSAEISVLHASGR